MFVCVKFLSIVLLDNILLTLCLVWIKGIYTPECSRIGTRPDARVSIGRLLGHLPENAHSAVRKPLLAVKLVNGRNFGDYLGRNLLTDKPCQRLKKLFPPWIFFNQASGILNIQ